MTLQQIREAFWKFSAAHADLKWPLRGPLGVRKIFGPGNERSVSSRRPANSMPLVRTVVGAAAAYAALQFRS